MSVGSLGSWHSFDPYGPIESGVKAGDVFGAIGVGDGDEGTINDAATRIALEEVLMPGFFDVVAHVDPLDLFAVAEGLPYV
jgi:hypothetical protein